MELLGHRVCTDFIYLTKAMSGASSFGGSDSRGFGIQISSIDIAGWGVCAQKGHHWGHVTKWFGQRSMVVVSDWLPGPPVGALSTHNH